MEALRKEIERLFALGAEAKRDPAARRTFGEFRAALTCGDIRAAQKHNGHWQANTWVKQGILLGFQIGELQASASDNGLSFVDKDSFPARRFQVSDKVRIVPGGTKCALCRAARAC